MEIYILSLQCVGIIETCQEKAEDLIKDLDLHILVHKAFGAYAFKLTNLSMSGSKADVNYEKLGSYGETVTTKNKQLFKSKQR